MKTLHFAGAQLVTGDQIAMTTVLLAKALANAGTNEWVEVPVISPDGSRDSAIVLFGPGSEVVLTNRGEGPELVDDSAVAAMTHRIRTLTGTRIEPHPFERASGDPLLDL